MGSVWKRLQRAGKRAAKVRFEATLEELLVEGGGSWTPDRLSVVWSRRQRRVCSKVAAGHPGPAAGHGGLGGARDPRGGRDPVPGPPGRPPSMTKPGTSSWSMSRGAGARWWPRPRWSWGAWRGLGTPPCPCPCGPGRAR
ncbi:EH domain-binding protein 1-like protein 1 isoform 1-T1 [Ammospiza maritima maritima]